MNLRKDHWTHALLPSCANSANFYIVPLWGVAPWGAAAGGVGAVSAAVVRDSSTRCDPTFSGVGSRVDDRGGRRGPCLSVPIATTDEPGPPSPPVFWPTWGGVRRKFGLGRRDPRVNGAEREGTRLRRDTGRPSAWLPRRWFSPRRGSISFRLAESREGFRYEVYLRIPNREVPSASRKLFRHHWFTVAFAPILRVVGRRPALFFLSRVGASPSELWGTGSTSFARILRVVDPRRTTDFSSLRVMRSPSELWGTGVGDVGPSGLWIRRRDERLFSPTSELFEAPPSYGARMLKGSRLLSFFVRKVGGPRWFFLALFLFNATAGRRNGLPALCEPLREEGIWDPPSELWGFVAAMTSET